MIMGVIDPNEATLNLGPAPEGVFKVKESAPKWLIMRVNAAARKGTEEDQMEAMRDFALACVIKEERQRLDQYMIDDDEAYERLEAALTELAQYWSGHPLAPSEPSSTPSPTDDIVPSSRVVSFSRGVVEPVIDEPPQLGPSETRAG